MTADGILVRNLAVFWLILRAYDVRDERRAMGVPDWVKRESYDIVAKVDPSQIEAFARLTPQQKNLMWRPVLEKRFHLQAHYETKVFPEYVLVIAKHGPKLKPAKPLAPSEPERVWKITDHYQLVARNISMPWLCWMLLTTEAREPVVDGTGLSGKYDFNLRWSRERTDATVSDAPDIFTAVESQLGLEMKSRKAPMKVIIIDKIEHPSPN